MSQTLLNEMKILRLIRDGQFAFKVESSNDSNAVEGFQSVVQIIRSLEKQGFVKVDSYLPLTKSHRHSHTMVRVLVENLTSWGKYELRRLEETQKEENNSIKTMDIPKDLSVWGIQN